MPEIEDLVNYAIIIAIAASLILFVTGKFLDLSVERQTSIQTRATLNLLQEIVTDGPFLMTDSGNNKLKLAIDKEAYIGSSSSELLECCDSLQYDYRFAVGVYDKGASQLTRPVASLFGDVSNVKVSGNPTDFNKRSECYFDFGVGGRSLSSVPVNICESGDLNSCEQGTAYIETVDSPLSQMSYWITQACESEFDLSKRIPIDKNDYDRNNQGYGNEIKLDSEKNQVCFNGRCKEYSCDTEVLSDINESLYDEEVSLFFSCRFVKVVKNSDGIFLIEPKPDREVEEKPPVDALSFLPADQDSWTESYFDHFSASGYIIQREIAGIPAAVGNNYIVLTHGIDVGNVADVEMVLDFDDVRDREILDDCDYHGSAAKCVNMDERNLDKLDFRTRLYFDNIGGEVKEGLITWKLTDSNDVCIQSAHTIFGLGKDVVSSNEWTQHTIDRNGAEQNYGSCELDLLGLPTSFPSSFNWSEIKSISFDACEKSLAGFTCANQLDSIDALLIDNLHFEVADNE